MIKNTRPDVKGVRVAAVRRQEQWKVQIWFSCKWMIKREWAFSLLIQPSFLAPRRYGRFAEGTTWSARWTYSLTASGSSPARSDQLVACLLQLSWVVFNQLIFNLNYLFQIIWVESLYMGAAKDREVAIVLLPWAVRHTSYLLLVKSNWWSIINAAFWLVELLLGYML